MKAIILTAGEGTRMRPLTSYETKNNASSWRKTNSTV